MSKEIPIPVRTLLGEKGFESSLLCLRSLVEYSADPVRLVIHEDGTLTDYHRDQLRAIDPGITFIGRAEADERVGGVLARHPRCTAARQTGVLFLKLFDIPLLTAGELAYSDSDVFFCRPYRGLFQVPADGRTVFMSDVSHAYGVRPWRVWPIGPLRLSGRVNTGIIVRPARTLNIDHIEWVLEKLASDAAFTRRAYWAEQTCWAAVATREPAALLDPGKFILASPTMDRYHRDVIAIHFVSTYRGKLADYQSRQRDRTDTPASVETSPVRRVGPVGMACADIRRRL